MTLIQCGIIITMSVVLGGMIGYRRGYLASGAALGLLGPLGWLIAAFMPLSPERQAEHEARVDAARARLRRVG